MKTDTTTTDETQPLRLTEQQRQDKLMMLGFTLAILSGPRGGVDKQHGENEWPHIAFDVQLEFQRKPVIETPYKLGIGHVKVAISERKLSDRQFSMFHAWQRNPHAKFKDTREQANLAAFLASEQKVKPTLCDVLHSLLSDGEAFFNAQTFEQWAGDLGYDADSRKAEAIFKLCDTIGRKLAQKIPAEVLAQAREILQDY